MEIQSKSQICGTSGKLNGLNCCYRLIDYFVERELLVQFSWGGGSRNEEGKMAFKKYNNVMSTFYKIINQADSSFTIMECQNFFKSIVKNAKRRFELTENTNDRRRASSGKKRPHNLNYKLGQEDKIQKIQPHNAEVNVEILDDIMGPPIEENSEENVENF
nr:unnamed protein product [Callosobruchus analis]